LQTYGGPQRDGLAYVGIPKAANDQAVDDGFGGLVDRRSNYSAGLGEVEYFHQPQVHLHHDLRLADRWDLNQTLFWIRGDGYFDFDATFRSANYLRLPQGFVADDLRDADLFTSAPGTSVFFRAAIDQHQVGWMPRVTRSVDWGQIVVGGEARLHRSLRWGRIQDGVDLPAELVGGENDVRVYSFRGEKAVVSGFASVLARPAEEVAVQYETRLTRRQYRVYDEAFFGTYLRAPFTFWDHRAGATLFPDRAVRGYANVALAHREPRLKTIYDGEEAGAGFRPQVEGAFVEGRVDPLVSPERGVTAEVGGEWDGVRHRLRLGGYGYWVDDEIVPSGGLDQFGVPRTGNAERTRHLGGEAEGSVRLARGLDLSGHLTLSSDRFVRFDEFAFAADGSVVTLDRGGNRIAGFPSRSGYVALSYARGGFTARLDATHAGSQPVDNSGGGGDLQVDAYTLVGAGASWRLPGRLAGVELSVEVLNLLDDEVLLSGNSSAFGPQFFPAATRHAFFLARYTLGRGER
jgi:iron complex outermembrane receptor protein